MQKIYPIEHEKAFLLNDFIRLNGRLITPSEDKEFYDWIVKLKRYINNGNLSNDDLKFIERVLPWFLREGNITGISARIKEDYEKSQTSVFNHKVWRDFCRRSNGVFHDQDFYSVDFLRKLTSVNIVSEVLEDETNTIKNGAGKYNLLLLNSGILYSLSFVPYKTAYILCERSGLFDCIPKDYKWLSEKLNMSCMDVFLTEKSALFHISKGSRNAVNFLSKKGYYNSCYNIDVSFDYRVRHVNRYEFVRLLKQYTFYDSVQKEGR